MAISIKAKKQCKRICIHVYCIVLSGQSSPNSEVASETHSRTCQKRSREIDNIVRKKRV